MNLGLTILLGFGATCILSIILIAARALQLTRIDIPFILGTMFSSDRDKAKVIGSFVHFLMGWIFAFIYVSAFEETRMAGIFFGSFLGLIHALTVLTIGMEIMSHLHPRMATEERGPEPTRQLEPPGYFVMNYGSGTPLATIAAHLLYGGALGHFYSIMV